MNALMLDLVEQVCAAGDAPLYGNAVALVLAHPDDETVGAGARLARWRAGLFVYLTDGAPRDMRDARAAGCATRAQYARARWNELRAALTVAGISPERVHRLGLVDQEAALQLVALVRRLEALLADARPAVVITHPYEGGHPDHDAAAFAVHAACRMLGARGGARPAIIEMAFYHNGAGPTWGRFLPDSAAQVYTYALTEQERHRRQALLNCYTSQRDTLQYSRGDSECFRRGPRYWFTRPPHAGRLFYERFGLGMTAKRWCELAAAALEALQLREAL